MLALRSLVAASLIGMVVVAPVGANAQSAPPKVEAKPDLGEPETVAKARAKLLFEKGVSAYRESRFYDAVDIFLETNRLYPDPKLSYNVGKAMESLGNQAGALRYYREYLRRLPDAPDAREVTDHVHQLEQALSQKGLQQVTILSTPEGATLKLDGQAVGVTSWTGESFAGKHRIVLEAAGYERVEAVVELDPHRARDFSFDLVKAAPEPSKKPAPCLPPVKEAKVSTFTLVTVAAGLGLLGTALIAQAAGSGNSPGISRTAAVFAGGGAGVTLVGGFMLYFDLSPSGPGASSSGLSFSSAGLEHGMSK